MAKAKLPTVAKVLKTIEAAKPKKILALYEEPDGSFRVIGCEGIPTHESARRMLQKAAERIG